MGKIQILEDSVANQIAAGEVVERPASAIKELVENAIDAHATHITVRVVDGGLTLMEVQDNGTGIAPDEVELAFVRHATSKLRTLDDLRRSRTLGFRGEALPSIASVSRVSIRTRTADASAGIEVRLDAGQLISQEPAGCPIGTRITVTDLFFNTPARLKFVRSLQTESKQIVEAVARAAMSRPDISFDVEVDGRTAFRATGDGQLATVFADVHGAAVTKGVISVSMQTPDYEVSGMISGIDYTRTSRSGMWFAVNGRPIRSIALSSAVVQGYHTALLKGRFPVVIITLTMDPSLLDVNVHPGKLEVRFSEEKEILALVSQAVHEALNAGITIPDVHITASAADRSAETPLPYAPKLQQRVSVPGGNFPARTAPQPARVPLSEETVQVAFEIQRPLQDEATPFKPNVRESNSPRPSELRAVAQVLQMYIVAEDGDAVYLIDQHAAHERVLYEKFREQSRARGIHPLPLLVPITLEVALAEVPMIESCRIAASTIGLEYETFGDRAFMIRSIPDVWEGMDIEMLVRDVFMELLETQGVAQATDLEDRVMMRACKAAVKAHQPLSQMEMNALMRALSGLENPFTCPHGRPTAIRMDRKQLEREFKRTV